jgi:PPM family protein phosphatase
MPTPSKIYYLNELGRRKNNEDFIWPPAGEAFESTRLFLVCDGVGGNSRGEVASELTCCYFNDYFEQNLRSEEDLNQEFVNAAREWVVQHFKDYISLNPEAADMSTTLTLAYLKRDSIFVAWCGDSRIHLIRNGEIIFQSQDHSLVNELVKRGDITAEEALTHPHRNVITRSIQAKQPYSEIQTAEIFDIQEHDYLLLCTDGLLERISPAVLKSVLTTGQDAELEEKIQEYCFEQTRDNYSMYLVELAGKKFQVESAQKVEVKIEKKRSNNSRYVVAFIIIILLLVAAYVTYNIVV